MTRHEKEILALPELAWRRRHALGQFEHVFRAAEKAPIAKRDSIHVSPRKSEDIYILESGERLIVTHRRNCPRPDDVDGVLLRSSSGLCWLSHRLTDGENDKRWKALHKAVSESWKPGINYAAEHRDSASQIETKGLRPPQIGALHAIAAHWSLHRHPATVVMPTGTGKTETMLATLVAEVEGALLVVVPSKALRDQTRRKFSVLGLLRELQVIGADVKNPIVGTLTKRPTSAADLDIFKLCHVVVATMPAIGHKEAASLLPHIAKLTDTIIIDEAHHVAAATWTKCREAFSDRRTLQFTATPFRRDGQLVDGDVIFSYPLRRAQEDGYFKPIRFNPIFEVDLQEADRAIAEKAIAQLEQDLAAGLDHLVMARCDTIDRAQTIHAVYEGLAPEHAPILIHSDDASSAQRISALLSRNSRIVVCVDMLGEGFDLPQLKIAAVHDTHKSLAVLLQFAGRFTRGSVDGIGDATVIANIADQAVSHALERLYSEDADWNHLLAEMSSQAVREHATLVDFLNASTPLHEEKADELSISPQLLRPKFSTVVFRASSFHPKRFHSGLSTNTVVPRAWLHEDLKTLYFVTRTEPAVKWTRSKQLKDRQWDLFVLHYNPELGVLFIHSSDKSSVHEDLANAVTGGSGPKLIRGDPVFRTLAKINRLQFQSLGVMKHARRNLRYAKYIGADVKQALGLTQMAGSTKSDLQGSGFEGGAPVSVGCSYKGRVWSKEHGPIRRFIDWCEGIGRKLVDESIETKSIIDNVMIPEEVDQLPDSPVLSIEWPIEILRRQEDRITLKTPSGEIPLSLFELVFDEVSSDRRSMRFHLESDGLISSYSMYLGASSEFVTVNHTEGDPLTILSGRLEQPLEKFFSDWPPLLRFIDMSELDGNLLVRPQEAQAPSLPGEQFEVWDWSDTDVTKESLWKDGAERPDSIQAKVAKRFIDGGFDVVFDDDASGEAADLVCMKSEGDHIRLVLVHCKFTKDPAGARVKDVVEVASQAVRSHRWLWNFRSLCRHISQREKQLKKHSRATRYLGGSAAALNRLLQESRFKAVRGEIVIVQPGLSQSGHTADQVAVLAAAHSFLHDTVNVSLDIICAP